ncbi:MAG: CHAT domain-containing protein [Anaerolineae bacterium]|nr:CHAT domain-containing protein [Anaerolineae bacterium]MDW8098173.1 CHAT domain-containing protein [Anaerolineae bacterium]
MEYYDFDLWVESVTAQGYPLRAISATQGGAKGWMSQDLLTGSMPSFLQRLEEGKTDAAFLIQFGAFLYNLLFPDEIAALFEANLGEVIRHEELGLRIRLRIAPPEISALPWEYLYVPRHRYFLGASRKTPLTRCLDIAPIRALRTTLPLKALVAIPGGSGLEADRERAMLLKATRKLKGAFQFRFLTGNVTRSTLSDALLEERYHIFHFIGHGVFQNDHGYLIFNREDGRDDPIDDEVFARFFLNEPSMKLVMLNTCEGAKMSSSRPMAGLAPKLVERGIPAVIAHQYPLANEASLRFTREFYHSLCTGTEAGHVDTAVAHARNLLSIHFPADPVLGAPVLFLRSPEGLIFDVQEKPPVEHGPAHSATRLSAEERKHLESSLALHERNRRVLEEQILRMGFFAPPYLKAQLADELAAIEEIRRRLDKR